jgi:hypothetical protein
MKYFFTFILLFLFLNTGCNENISNTNTNSSNENTELNNTQTTKSATDFNISDDFAIEKNTNKCFILNSSSSANNEENSNFEVDGTTSFYIENYSGVWTETECPSEEVEEPQEQITTINCFELSENECNNYSEECRVYKTNSPYSGAYIFDSNNFCVKPDVKFISCIKKHHGMSGTLDDSLETTGVYKYTDNDEVSYIFMNQANIIEELEYEGLETNEYSEFLNKFEFSQELFENMLLYYQELSKTESLLYTQPKDCE